jgi:hypothetical protein
MVWSETFSMWVDVDNRTIERKAKDEKTMNRAELQYILDQMKGITEVSLEYTITKEQDDYGDKMRMGDIKSLIMDAQFLIDGP